MIAVAAEFDCGIYCLKQRLGVDTGDDEISLIDSLGALGAGTYADCRERMSYACEEAAFFRKRAAVAHHGKCVHLQAVVVMESQRLMLNHARVELKPAGGKTVAATGMTTVEYRHVIFLRHCIDGIEETEEVLLRINILFAVGT